MVNVVNFTITRQVGGGGARHQRVIWPNERPPRPNNFACLERSLSLAAKVSMSETTSVGSQLIGCCWHPHSYDSMTGHCRFPVTTVALTMWLCCILSM
jgi:hypothetical protein